MKSQVVAVDFDGTCVTHEYPKIGTDIGAVPVLKKIQAAGHKIVLNTMRSGELLQEAVEWFNKQGIELYGVNRNPDQTWTESPKVYAQVYIDDAALGCPLKLDLEKSPRFFVNWEKVETYLEMYGILK